MIFVHLLFHFYFVYSSFFLLITSQFFSCRLLFEKRFRESRRKHCPCLAGNSSSGRSGWYGTPGARTSHSRSGTSTWFGLGTTGPSATSSTRCPSPMRTRTARRATTDNFFCLEFQGSSRVRRRRSSTSACASSLRSTVSSFPTSSISTCHARRLTCSEARLLSFLSYRRETKFDSQFISLILFFFCTLYPLLLFFKMSHFINFIFIFSSLFI